MGKAFAAFAASYFVLVLLKDGSLTKLIGDASAGAKDLAAGIKPITTAG